MEFAPLLPSRYQIRSEVQAEIDALSQDLGLELVSKSRVPFYGVLWFRGLRNEMGVRFILDSRIQYSRDLCARLSERNHHRKDFRRVYKSDYNNEELSLW